MEEPLFNFVRLSGAIPQIGSSAATCGLLCYKFLAIGTNSGSVHLLDLTGRELRRLQVHKSRVTDLCTDDGGDYVGVSSEDGQVAVAAVHTDEVHTHTNHKAARAIRIAPDYARNRDRPVVLGGLAGKLRCLRRQWLLGNTSEKILHEGEGPVRAITWRGSLIAWANDVGVKVVDVSSEERVCYIECAALSGDRGKDKEAAAVLEACPPRLQWVGDNKLLIGWLDMVRVVAFKEKRLGLTREQAEAAGVPLPAASLPPPPSFNASKLLGVSTGGTAAGAGSEEGGKTEEKEDPSLIWIKRRYGEVLHRVALGDTYAAGVAGYGDHIAVLGCEITEAPGGGPGLPNVDLRVLTYEGAELSRDTLRVRGTTPSTLPKDLHLLTDPDSVQGADGLPVLYVLAPQDVIVATPRSVADHIQWAWSQGSLERAVEVELASPGALPANKVTALRADYLNHRREQGHGPQAALACATLLGSDPANWESWVSKFLVADDSSALALSTAVSFLSVLPLPAGVTWEPSHMKEADGKAKVPAIQAVRPQCTLPAPSYDAALAYLLRTCPLDAESATQAWRVKRRVVSTATAPVGAGVEGGSPPRPKVKREASAEGRSSSALSLVNPAALLGKALRLGASSASGAQATQAALQAVQEDEGAVDGDAPALTPAMDIAMEEVAVESPVMDPLYTLDAVLADVGLVIQERGTLVSAEDLQCLRDIRAELFIAAGQPDQAVRACLGYLGTLSGASARTAAQHILSLITTHHLHHLISGEIVPLLEAGREETLALIVSRVDAPTGSFPIPGILAQLRGRPRDQHAYLSHLSAHKWEHFNGQAGAPFHSLYARLTAQYCRPALLPFLQKTSHLSLEDMRVMCEEGVEGDGQPSSALQRELAWVLGRLGAAREALSLLLDGLGDVKGAVEFVAGVEDDALWEEMVSRIVRSGSGDMAGQLLDALPGTGLNAVKVLAALPPSVPIPNLQRRLLNVLHDANVARRLTVICGDLIRRDTFALHARLVGRQNEAIRCTGDEAVCGLCSGMAAETRLDYAQVGRRGRRGRSGTAGTGENDGGEGGETASQRTGGMQEDAGTEAGGEPCMVLFWCRHAFHDTCLRSSNNALGGSARAGRGRLSRARSASSVPGGGRGASFAEGSRGQAVKGPGRGRSAVPAGGPRPSFDQPDVYVRARRSMSSVTEGGDREEGRGAKGGRYGKCPLCFSQAGKQAAD